MSDIRQTNECDTVCTNTCPDTHLSVRTSCNGFICSFVRWERNEIASVRPLTGLPADFDFPIASSLFLSQAFGGPKFGSNPKFNIIPWLSCNINYIRSVEQIQRETTHTYMYTGRCIYMFVCKYLYQHLRVRLGSVYIYICICTCIYIYTYM